MHRFSKRSWKNLKGVDPRLVAIASRALAYSPVDFVVTEGVRSLERQRELVNAGASWTMRSKHLTGKAIDVAAYVDGIYSIVEAFKKAAVELKVPLVWGGDWAQRDGPHFELDS